MNLKSNMHISHSSALDINIVMTDALSGDRMAISTILNPPEMIESTQMVKSEDRNLDLGGEPKPTQMWLPPMISEPIENVQDQSLPRLIKQSHGSQAELDYRRRSRTLSPPQLPIPRRSPPLDLRRRSNVGWNLGQYRISENAPFYHSGIDVYNSSTYFDTLDEPLKVKSKTRPHFSNKAYTREQVDFCRYLKQDCEMSFDEVKMQFRKQFPDVLRDSNQCFSSRYYRDNVVPRLDESRRLMFDDKGKLLLEEAKVRDRTTPEGKAKCVPFTLVDKWPHRALNYEWVSKEHKSIARLILDGIDPTDLQGKKAEWRRILREAEDHM